MALEIKDENFEEFLNDGKPFVVDFWATWCSPCKQIAPYIEELAQEFEGKVIVGKCDIESNSELPARFGIMSIPTILFFKNGEIVYKHVGAGPKATLKEKIETML